MVGAHTRRARQPKTMRCLAWLADSFSVRSSVHVPPSPLPPRASRRARRTCASLGGRKPRRARVALRHRVGARVARTPSSIAAALCRRVQLRFHAAVVRLPAHVRSASAALPPQPNRTHVAARRFGPHGAVRSTSPAPCCFTRSPRASPPASAPALTLSLAAACAAPTRPRPLVRRPRPRPRRAAAQRARASVVSAHRIHKRLFPEYPSVHDVILLMTSRLCVDGKKALSTDCKVRFSRSVRGNDVIGARRLAGAAGAAGAVAWAHQRGGDDGRLELRVAQRPAGRTARRVARDAGWVRL